MHNNINNTFFDLGLKSKEFALLYPSILEQDKSIPILDFNLSSMKSIILYIERNPGAKVTLFVKNINLMPLINYLKLNSTCILNAWTFNRKNLGERALVNIDMICMRYRTLSHAEYCLLLSLMERIEMRTYIKYKGISARTYYVQRSSIMNKLKLKKNHLFTFC